MALADKQTQKNKRFIQSFFHAINGIKTAFYSERNLRYHAVATAVVILLGWYVSLSVSEWLFLLVAVFSVWIAEMFNTSIEHLVDLVTKGEYHDLAKKTKDIASGAVLLSALFAFSVGLIIFLPKLFSIIGG